MTKKRTNENKKKKEKDKKEKKKEKEMKMTEKKNQAVILSTLGVIYLLFAI